MSDHLLQLARHICKQLRILGHSHPRIHVLRTLLDIAYLASLKTEESRFVRGSMTYCDPSAPETDTPPRRRSDYPFFTPFAHRSQLTVDLLVKLSRAVDRWSGSIAVYGTRAADIVVWGVVDQLVHQNVRLNREAMTGYAAPGIVSVTIDGVGEVSAYHGSLFLGRLKQGQVTYSEVAALQSPMVINRVEPALVPFASSIAAAVGAPEDEPDMLAALLDAWVNIVSRICIGLRRMGNGGSLLITPKFEFRTFVGGEMRKFAGIPRVTFLAFSPES